MNTMMIKIILVIILYQILVCESVTINNNHNNNNNGDDENGDLTDIVQQWNNRFDMTNFGQQLMTWNDRLQKLLSTKINVSHDCRYALNEYFKNPFRHNWTMKS